MGFWRLLRRKSARPRAGSDESLSKASAGARSASVRSTSVRSASASVRSASAKSLSSLKSPRVSSDKDTKLEKLWFGQASSPIPLSSETVAMLRAFAAKCEVPEEIRTFVTLFIRNRLREQFTLPSKIENEQRTPEDAEILECEHIEPRKPTLTRSRTVASHPRVRKVDTYSLTQPRLQGRINSWLKTNRMSTLDVKCLSQTSDATNNYATSDSANSDSANSDAANSYAANSQSANSQSPNTSLYSLKRSHSLVSSASFTPSCAPSFVSVPRSLVSSVASAPGLAYLPSKSKLRTSSLIPDDELALVPVARSFYNHPGAQVTRQLSLSSRFSARKTSSLDTRSIIKLSGALQPDLDLHNANHYSDVRAMAGPYPAITAAHRC